MTKTKIIDYDIIYLSYDEPNAEKNYADLCQCGLHQHITGGGAQSLS